MTLGENLTIHRQSIGAAYLAYGFSGIDGILGYVPVSPFLADFADF